MHMHADYANLFKNEMLQESRKKLTVSLILNNMIKTFIKELGSPWITMISDFLLCFCKRSINAVHVSLSIINNHAIIMKHILVSLNSIS